MCTVVLPACMSVYHACAVLTEARGGPLELELRMAINYLKVLGTAPWSSVTVL